MKKAVIGGILIILSMQWMHAQTDSVITPPDTTSFAYANVLYDQGKYADAAVVYTNLLHSGGPSAELYYNLGNCYYKLKRTGPCILNYERARALDPGDEDIAYNADLAGLLIRDKMESVNEMLLLIWWRWCITRFPLHTWTIVSLLALWIAAAGFLVYRFSREYKPQKNGFTIFLFACIVFFVCIIAAFGRNAYDKQYSFAVVMAPSSIIKSEPGETGTNLFLIHEGLKIRILHPQENWTEIKMPDGNVGWIRNADIEKI